MKKTNIDYSNTARYVKRRAWLKKLRMKLDEKENF